MKYWHESLLSVGHLVTDINQEALSIMLPFLLPVMIFPMRVKINKRYMQTPKIMYNGFYVFTTAVKAKTDLIL